MKLLIVDDEPIIVRGLRKLLDYNMLGFTAILTATSSKKALALLYEEMPHIMLSDIAMPGLTGLDLLREIQAQGLDTSVIFLSGYPNFSYAQEAIKLGAVDYLLKPVEQDKLILALQKAATLWQQSYENTVLEKRLQGFDDDNLSSDKWLKGDLPNSSLAIQYLLICMQVDAQFDENTLAASIKRFSAFNKADNIATQNGCVCFVKDEHLVIIIQDEDKEALLKKSMSVQEIIKLGITVPIMFAQSDILPDTRSIPQAHRRCVAYLDAAQPVPAKSEASTIEKVKHYIAQNYAQPLSLETMAQVACVTTVYFSAYFSKQTGVGFKDYLTHTRIEAAKQLLTDTDLRVYEIADRVGFTNARYFSETFKKKTKLLPQQYREQYNSRQKHI